MSHALRSANDPKRTWATIASGGLHEARIYEPPMEGQNLAPRLTSEIPTLTRHHQSLAFSLCAESGSPAASSIIVPT